MTERDLIRAIMLAASERGARLFRNTVGMGWTGTVSHCGSTVIIENARPLHAGLIEGSADLIGWSRGLFTAVEVKTGKTRTTTAQQQFIDQVLAASGRAGIARSVEDALAILALDKV